MPALRSCAAALPCEVESVSAGRHLVRTALSDWDLYDVVDDAELGASELIANAVRHAGTDVVLTVRVDDAVTITVTDGHPQLHRPFGDAPDPYAEGGRGLRIVAAIASDWGIEALADGKCIWFDLPLPADARAVSEQSRDRA